MRLTILAILAAVALPAAAPAAVRVTEFMYQGFGQTDREFFELTNIGNAAVDVTTWSYNDDNLATEPVHFDALGLSSIGANESVVFTQMTEAAFRANWNLPGTVRIFSYAALSNLGNGDAINIFNSHTQNAAILVDNVTYGSGTTRGVSLNLPVGFTGPATGANFVYSSVGDAYGSRYYGAAGSTDLGNPGSYPLAAAAVPEPAAWATMMAGFGLVGGALRRRRSVAFA